MPNAHTAFPNVQALIGATSKADPDFSLVICTVDRENEVLRRVLNSIVRSRIGEIEVIVVDQNNDERVRACVEEFGFDLPIRWIRSTKGLSKARNVGVSAALGKIVGFPDDDCWYYEETLLRVWSAFDSDKSLDFLAGIILDDFEQPCIHQKWPHGVHRVSVDNINRTVASASLFFRRKSLVENLAPFDEMMGAGAMFGSCEEVDLVYRGLMNGFSGIYDSNVRIGHPKVPGKGSRDGCGRAFKYSLGSGYFMRKHRFRFANVVWSTIAPVLGSILSLFQFDLYGAKYYWETARGRAFGWWMGRKFCGHRAVE